MLTKHSLDFILFWPLSACGCVRTNFWKVASSPKITWRVLLVFGPTLLPKTIQLFPWIPYIGIISVTNNKNWYLNCLNNEGNLVAYITENSRYKSWFHVKFDLMAQQLLPTSWLSFHFSVLPSSGSTSYYVWVQNDDHWLPGLYASSLLVRQNRRLYIALKS